MLMGCAWNDFKTRLEKPSSGDAQTDLVSQCQLKLLNALQQHLLSVWGQCHSRPTEVSFRYFRSTVARHCCTHEKSPADVCTIILLVESTGYSEAAGASQTGRLHTAACAPCPAAGYKSFPMLAKGSCIMAYCRHRFQLFSFITNVSNSANKCNALLTTGHRLACGGPAAADIFYWPATAQSGVISLHHSSDTDTSA